MEENVTAKSANGRTIGLTYGLYSAAVSSVIFLVVSLLGYNPFGGGLNYIGTVAAIVLLVFAHKQYKSTGDGYMSYGQGFGIGFWFTLISTLLTVLIMYVYITIDETPMKLMLEENALKMQEQGQSDQTIETAQEWTKKLFWPFAIVGALFFGLLIPLIVTIFTQKKNPEAIV
jgi:hypothetical protein